MHGLKIQLTMNEDKSPRLDTKGIRLTQSVAGAALRIGRMLDVTILVACNNLRMQQTKSTI